jgi:hypothetical protein
MVAFALETKSAPAVPEGMNLEMLGDARQREKLSGSAIRLFMKLADVWQLNVDQRCRLLGDISKPTYHNWQNGKFGTLSRDQIERISLLLGIHRGLKLLFADDAAGMRWLKSANADIPFGERSPLERALRGSVNDLYAVRRYIDAWRGMK